MDQFRIPIIREVLNNLQGCTIFAEFDLAEAYLQFRLHPDSQPYTAFTWGNKQYMFVACPFGLCNMPSHFQRIIQYVFRDIPATIPYFDNIPFGSHDWEEHATHVYAIIETCNRYNLKIKPSSIKIGQAQLNCLGHLVTPKGISISHDKLVRVQEWPLPRSGKQLASFLGLITFIRQHIRHFADLTAEFESLKRSTGPIEWTPERLYKLKLLQQAITQAPLLVFPDFSKTFYIATDASCLGIGGVLYQPSETDNEDITGNNIIAICSKKLNECQQRYSTYKKELFAVIYCLKQFHSYIWGYKFVLITDHMPLVYLLTSSRLAHALQQWLDVVLEYQFIIKHRPGILHVLPDALSRLYELNYTDTWGIPSRDPYEVVQEHGLTIDKEILLQMAQPPPLIETKSTHTPRSTTTYSRTIATARSSSLSPRLQVDLIMDDDDNSENEQHDLVFPLLDNQQFSPLGLPLNELLEVRNSPHHGLGLFTRQGITIFPGDHIAHYGGELIDLDEFWERYPNQEDARYVVYVGGRLYRDAAEDFASLGRYANTHVPCNARITCNPRTHTARLVASRRINPGAEVFSTYGIGHRRARGGAASVSQLPVAMNLTETKQDTDIESKYDEPQESSSSLEDSDVHMITMEPNEPPISLDELKVIAAMEYRGKSAPRTQQEKEQLIMKEHTQGHFGREAIFRTLYRKGYWWPGIRQDIQGQIRKCLPCLRHVIAKTGFDPSIPITAVGSSTNRFHSQTTAFGT